MTRILLPLLALVMFAAPVDAQSRRELARRLDAVEARMAEMDQQRISQMDQLLTRIGDLEYQVQEATGTIERLEFDNRRLGQRIDAQDREIQSLRSQIEQMRRRPAEPQYDEDGNLIEEDEVTDSGYSQTPAGPGSGPRDLTGGRLAVTDENDPFASDRAAATQPLGGSMASAADRAPVMSANQAYGQARAKLLDGDFDGAQEDFSSFIADYPDDELVDEAWFWLGETHYVRGDYSSAAEAYITSLREERNGSVAPDALVRLASSLAALGRNDEACSTLARFSREFPSAGPNARARADREALRAGCR
ncbi:tol-pal system protein YbgF [Hyphobacterium sp. HN65]|uniref:Cell division coordinator CpoB n=1 Tax=Hyphobacterium lacteum TaxID=3116575 RepID=A0ABU7LPT1_9PROT|nr:tol-pal system protein YbgF [Hyphobacterium sp. HN65]MEE2525912.1 tol-pal system protein YbgF [Hyphobacterium sp. HN65]